ncbi:MAG: hypothetical protein U9R74_00720 [Pseudomonadota bacterium]|nr:hypothetical protein [Pseudomonadota bacterium]
MTRYGLYIRDLAGGDLVWFTTEEPLDPGAYFRGRHHAGSPNVYIAESIPALVLQIGPVIQQVEDLGQASLAMPDTSANARDLIEKDMTGGLLRDLTETSSIWDSNPRWVHHLRPCLPRGD